MTLMDSEKAHALGTNPNFQGRILYCIWRHALFVWNSSGAAGADKQLKLDTAKALQADPVKLAVVTQLILTDPGVIGVIDPANGGGDVDDDLLLGQAEQHLVFWGTSILGLA